MDRQIDSVASSAGGRPFLRGQNTELLRAVPKRARLAEVRCTAVPGRHGRTGWLVMVIPRGYDASALERLEQGEKFYVLTCKCGTWHAVSPGKLAEGAAAATRARSVVPAQLTVAALAA